MPDSFLKYDISIITFIYLLHLNVFFSVFCSAVVCHSFMSDSMTPWTLACQTSLSMGILQARILEWVAMPFSRWSSQPRDWTQVSRVAGGFFTIWIPWKSKNTGVGSISLFQGNFLTPELNWDTCITGGFFNSWSTWEAFTITHRQERPFFPLLSIS